MDGLLSYILPAVTLVIGLVAITGDTFHSGKGPLIRRITPTGWTLALFLLVSFGLTILNVRNDALQTAQRTELLHTIQSSSAATKEATDILKRGTVWSARITDYHLSGAGNLVVELHNAFIDDGFYPGPSTIHVQIHIPDDPTLIQPMDVLTFKVDIRGREVMLRNFFRSFERKSPGVAAWIRQGTKQAVAQIRVTPENQFWPRSPLLVVPIDYR